MNYDKSTCSTICTCDFYSQDLNYMKPPAARRAERDRWTRAHSNMPKIYEELLDELFCFHTGTLHGFNREVLDLRSYDANGDDIVDLAFGNDASRTLRRFFFYEGKENLRRELWDLAMLVSHAGRIKNCRTVGFCAQRALHGQNRLDA